MAKQEGQTPSGPSATLTSKLDEAKNLAQDVAENAQRQGREKFESGKQTAATQTEKLADVVERAARELGDGEQQTLADYAGQLATGMRTLAENLRGKSLDELFRDTQALARKNPTVFFIGSVVAGIAVSRFLKASGARTSLHKEYDYDYASQPPVPSSEFESAGGFSPSAAGTLGGAAKSSFSDDVKKGT